MTDETMPEMADEPVETTDIQESDPDDVEESSTSDSDDATAEQPRKVKGVQKRIDELTHNWRETERDRDYWRNMAMQMQSQPKPEAPEPQPNIDPYEPRIEQFDDYDEYLVAKAEYRIESKQREAQKAEREKQKQAAQQQQVADFQSKMSEARAKYTDFDRVAFDPNVPYSDAMTDLVLRSEKGADVAYYLGTHKDEALRIAQLDDRSAAYEIGRLEVRLSIPKPRTVTQAPEPPGSVGGKETPGKDPEKMTTAEWMAWRNSQLR